MPPKSVPASITETAFDCPHCGAYTTQYWYHSYGELIKDSNPPHLPDEELKERFLSEKEIPEESRKSLLDWIDNMNSGLVFIERLDKGNYVYEQFNNHFLSTCYNCKKVSVWVHDKLIFPSEKSGTSPNQDLPDDIVQDYEEARSILNLSPRGAAALLRLCVQKLCSHLGESGKNIDNDIASLVAKGLNPLVQKSLDVVRVIGNEAVHPGTIDLKDDRTTALSLFDLINMIAEQMISVPKHVDAMYEKLPPSKREAIDQRNEKAKEKK